MNCEFRGKDSVFFKEVDYGQVFRYGREMFFATEAIWSAEDEETMNAVSLEDGRLAAFEPLAEVILCKLVGYFEPMATVGE